MPRKAREFPWIEQRNGVFYAQHNSTTRETKRVSLRTRDGGEARERFAAFLIEGKRRFEKRDKPELRVSDALDAHYLGVSQALD